jgi:hypothetical protein
LGSNAVGPPAGALHCDAGGVPYIGVPWYGGCMGGGTGGVGGVGGMGGGA